MNTKNYITFYRVASYLLMLGVIHSALTPVFYDFFSLNGMWFFGTGLCLVFLGFLNIAASRLLDLWLLRFTLFANLIGTTFSILILFVLNKAQAYVGLVFNLVVLIAGFMVLRIIKNEYESLK